MNLEHALIEDESKLSDEEAGEIEAEGLLSRQYDMDAIQAKMETDAKKKADKILRKNKREIARLKKHAGNCLIENNFFGYSYAIKKLRGFYKQPYTEELIQTMWDTSRQSILDIIENNKGNK